MFLFFLTDVLEPDVAGVIMYLTVISIFRSNLGEWHVAGKHSIPVVRTVRPLVLHGQKLRNYFEIRHRISKFPLVSVASTAGPLLLPAD